MLPRLQRPARSASKATRATDPSPRTILGSLAAVVLAAGLAGCASLNNVDSEVRSYSQWPSGRSAGSYAFERLPSQAAEPERQSELENAARVALSKAGFTESASTSQSDVVVQLGARISREDRSPWDDPIWWNGWYYRSRWAPGPWGPGWWGGGPYWSMRYDTPRYEREVAVLIRDRQSGQPLYESRATNDSLSRGDTATLAAMYEAALKDFPTPSVNPRRISVPLASTP